ncbi:restriction endonuclease subunit S [Streptococcus orisratti]|uniref:restriction endonuclease subunit S n=1 Tax=Streptococcus orisratti TaxID=114652 RepID=UPI003CFC1C5D
MKPTNNIPAYRFQGYTDAWELRKLGELGTVAMCRRIFKEQTSEIGEIPFYKIGTFGGTPDAFISKELFEEYRDKYSYPTKGDILISASGSIGRTVEFLGKDEYFQDSNIVWLKHDGKIDNIFLKQFYSIVKWSGVEGSTIKRLYNENILNTEIALPTLPEQEAIGTFFSTLDQHITLHQRKLDTLKEQKKTYLKLLFPAKGQIKPALRFQGFEDDWKEVKLGEIVVWEKGSGLSKSDLNIEDRGGKVIHYADLYRYKEVITEIFHSSESIEGKAIPLNSLLFPMSDVTPQGLARASSISIEGVRAGGDILIANIKDNSSIFLSYQVNANYRYILPLVTGTTVRHISSTSLSTIPISLPSLPEQEAIGSFFSTLDQEIAQVEDKLASLKEMKKTLLRKLFVS